MASRSSGRLGRLSTRPCRRYRRNGDSGGNEFVFEVGKDERGFPDVADHVGGQAVT
ncbi:MAG: hypothetical protein QG608_1880 [Actinomycetota bacterium]|nr:hypothetical protein [Actinomycetota bacterium]